MSSPNPLVNRLQQQQNRIARMLSPGSRRLPAEHGSWGFSPVAPDFGGRKFQIAAQKMRILDAKKLGDTHSVALQGMAGALQSKFENLQDLLHLSPGSPGQASFWSEVEKVFPSQAAPRAETPSETGDLRQGSVIQKFSPFPKPGQSADEFKSQLQRNPVVRKTETAAPKPVRLNPRDRLFSRVQELTPGGREPKTVAPENPEPPAAPPAGETVQRQPEPQPRTVEPAPAAPRPEVRLSRPAAEKPDLPEARSQPPVHPPMPVEVPRLEVPLSEVPARPLPGVWSGEPAVPAQPEPAPKAAAAPRSLPETSGRVNAEAAPLPVARASRAKPEPDKAPPLPVARPVSFSAPKKDAPVPSASISRAPVSHPVVQRAPETAAARPAPAAARPVEPAKSSPIAGRETPGPAAGLEPLEKSPDFAASVSAFTFSPSAAQTPDHAEPEASPDFPLKQRIEQQRQISRAHPMAAREVPQLKITSQPPLLKADKYRRPAPGKAPTPELPQRTGGRPALERSAPPQAVESFPLHQPPAASMPSPAARTTAFSPSFAAQLLKPPLPPAPPAPLPGLLAPPPALAAESSAALSSLAEAARPAPTPQRGPAAQNVVQRVWEEHGEVQHGQAPSSKPGSPDGNALAEKILPFVKRLLEIESERTGGRFH